MISRVSMRAAGLMLGIYLACMAGDAILAIANGNSQRDDGTDYAMVVAFTAFMTVGVVIVARPARQRLGLLGLAVLCHWTVERDRCAAMKYAEYAYITRRSRMPASVLAA